MGGKAQRDSPVLCGWCHLTNMIELSGNLYLKKTFKFQ